MKAIEQDMFIKKLFFAVLAKTFSMKIDSDSGQNFKRN